MRVLQDGATVKDASSLAATKRDQGTVFVDLYQADLSKAKLLNLNLVARFRGRGAAQDALARPEFLREIVRRGTPVYMSTLDGCCPDPAGRLPAVGDEDERCWFRAYARVIGGSTVVLWSLIWPRAAMADEALDRSVGA